MMGWVIFSTTEWAGGNLMSKATQFFGSRWGITQPVILTNRKMKEIEKGIFQVLVDTETSSEKKLRVP